ncbi:unnamed protein product [Leptosia nina]|uniref:Uncharacterized protein n=1 Tax=Leptosia nina TaxID=320188 RepID=A0AAV1K040_9NEOP
MKPLSTAVMLNKRILITAANYLEPYMNRQMDLRIWALGRAGLHTTPYRYRVWRIWRLFPKSNNPEHLHGPRGEHCPRHDVSLIISRDPIYIYYVYPYSWQYPHRAWLIDPHTPIVGTETEDQDNLLFVGSGFEYLEHVRENYKIYFALPKVEHIVDCSKYLPKHWGKFICFRNVHHYSGVQNGGGLFLGKHVIGIGSFEIRVNEDRILVFTDLRYYTNIIRKYASIHPGQYYEYAHSEWFAYQSYFILGWDRQNSLKRLPIHYADGKNVGNVYTLG